MVVWHFPVLGTHWKWVPMRVPSEPGDWDLLIQCSPVRNPSLKQCLGAFLLETGCLGIHWNRHWNSGGITVAGRDHTPCL